MHYTAVMKPLIEGHLRKMANEPGSPADYFLIMDEQRLHLNPWLGKKLQLNYRQRIHCIYCDRKTSKSFNQGYCYPCFQKLARCDRCVMSPERCHYEQGTCREPEWGEAFCMQDHIVYLANTSGIKVGITRVENVPYRWLDQGATQALPIYRVKSRFQSGLVEDLFKAHISDKTAWQSMLKGDNETVDLPAERERLTDMLAGEIRDLQNRFGIDAIAPIARQEAMMFSYPVLTYPAKVRSLNLDKALQVGGQLLGIKAQYLIFDTGVINIRKYSGYEVELVSL